MKSPQKETASIIPSILAVTALAACGWLLFVRGINPEQKAPPQSEYPSTTITNTQLPAGLTEHELFHTITCDFKYPVGIAVLPGQQIALIGDKRLKIINHQGQLQHTEKLEQTPRAIASHNTTLAIALQDKLLVLNTADLKNRSTLTIPKDWLVPSVAINEKYIAIANATNASVVLYSRDGKHLRNIPDKDSGIPAPIIPSPYFAVTFSPEGYLLSVDPGRHLIKAFNTNGALEFSWGKSGIKISDFSGCCNPTDIAILPDQSVVTAEKGTPRVKVYDPGGKLSAIVAGGEYFNATTTGITLAVNSEGTILVLDPAKKQILFFRVQRIQKEQP